MRSLPVSTCTKGGEHHYRRPDTNETIFIISLFQLCKLPELLVDTLDASFDLVNLQMTDFEISGRLIQ